MTSDNNEMLLGFVDAARLVNLSVDELRLRLNAEQTVLVAGLRLELRTSQIVAARRPGGRSAGKAGG